MPGGFTSRNFGRRGRRRGAKAIAHKALREVNKIKSNIEHKFLEVTIAQTPVAGTEGVTHLTPITDGTDAFERVGSMVSLKSIQIRGTIGLVDPTGTFENEVVRLLVFIDKNGEAVHTTLDDVLLDAAVLESMRQPQHMNDFRVLMDKTITLQNLSLNTDSSLRFFSFFKRFKRPIQIRFDGVAGTAVEENQLYLGVQVLQSIAAGSVVISGRSLIKFTDM